MTDATAAYDLDELLRLAVTTAEEAGELLLSYAKRLRSLTVETKTSLTDPVSEADRDAETLIASRLLAVRPDDGFLGEEAGANSEGTSGLRWVVDPLDGTVNFLYGIPSWCVSIACEDATGSVVGVVRDPSTGETFAASREGPTTLDGDPVTVNDVGLDRALIATGFAYEPELRVAQGHKAAQLLARARDIRRAGAAALDLAWVAAGRVDGYYEIGLKHWDWAAGRLLVERAGGVVSPFELEAAGARHAGLLAGGRRLHDELGAFLAA